MREGLRRLLAPGGCPHRGSRESVAKARCYTSRADDSARNVECAFTCLSILVAMCRGASGRKENSCIRREAEASDKELIIADTHQRMADEGQTLKRTQSHAKVPSRIGASRVQRKSCSSSRLASPPPKQSNFPNMTSVAFGRMSKIYCNMILDACLKHLLFIFF